MEEKKAQVVQADLGEESKEKAQVTGGVIPLPPSQEDPEDWKNLPPSKHLGRAWCFTVNNYKDEHIKMLEEAPVRYIIWGYEKGALCGTPHIQGYMYFQNMKSKLKLIKTFGNQFSWRYARGDDFNNWAYCRKQGLYEVRGTPPSKGKSQSLQDMAQLAMDPKIPMRQVIGSNPEVYMRFHNGVDKIRRAFLPDRIPGDLAIIWIHGDGRQGKSRCARHWCNTRNISYFEKDSTKWWGDYSGEEAIIWSDFNPLRNDAIQFDDLMQAMDRWANKYSGQTKGGYASIGAKYMFFCSIRSPDR